MRTRSLISAFGTLSLTTLVTLAMAPGCGSKDAKGFSTGDGGSDGGFNFEETPPDLRACANATFQGEQAPAAMLVVLDRSSSMSEGGKWNAAANALVTSLDDGIFDTMSVGLYAAPSGSVTGPACIFGTPVACSAPPFPQVPLEVAGAAKADDSQGVRKAIKSWLANNSPDNGQGDASPLYMAVRAGLDALKAWNKGDKRILLVVTDGTISCNELSSPTRPGYPDANGCARDWENPGNIIDMVKAENTTANKPVETFVVGVPGADTYDPSATNYPPYHMRAALSAIAYAGAPNYAPENCTGKDFTQQSADPSVSCHFDMTQQFSTEKLAEAIAVVRGKVLGCTFKLPTVEGGQEVDRSKVNVTLTAGGTTGTVLKRTDASDNCSQDGCWDYDAQGKVQLIGKSCDQLKAQGSVKVDIVTGCTTQVK